MSQPSLLQAQSSSPTSRPASTKSEKKNLSKTLKHAFSRRKRSGSLRVGNDELDLDGISQRSGSIGPESFLSNEHSIAEEPRMSEDVTIEQSPHRGRSPSRRIITQPSTTSLSQQSIESSPTRRPVIPIVLSSPLPNSTDTFPTLDQPQDFPKEPKPNLSLQTSHAVPAMSVTPATPINPPSAPNTPDKTSKGILSHQRSWSRINTSSTPSTPNKDEKTMTTSGSVGGAVWGSLLNAANKVTDTISSLTTQNNSSNPGLNRSVPAAPPDDNITNLVRPRSQTLPATGSSPLATEDEIDELPKQMAIDTLGQGELSLKELGFDSDVPNVPHSSAGSSMLAQDDFAEKSEQTDFPAKRTADLNGHSEHNRNESIGRSRRSLTVPTRGVDSMDTERRLSPISTRKPRRLSSLSKRDVSRRRDESVASKASSEAATADNVSRRARKRSSLTTDNGFDSPKLRPAGTPDASEDRENEDGLYIHGKDGKKRRVPITGFAVQSGKRNRDFHALFKSVEESDYLIEDYSCALSKEILVQGRINIFGWVTNLIIAFTEVVSIEKRSTAVLFPNGIQITTLHAKYVFASFVGRDGTYDLLTSIWRLSHPDSRSPDDPYDSESISHSSGSYTDDEGSFSDDAEDASMLSNASGDESDDKSVSPAKTTAGTPSSEKKKEEAEASATTGDTGPESHEKTECDCGKDGHYDKVICDEVVKIPLGKVWNCVYGENKEFMMSFLKDNQKVLDITMGDWKGEGAKRERQVSYIKPLNNSMGPKQTKCNITEQAQQQDYNSSCVALTTTTTPDVPSGSSFQVMTKYCMMWAGGSSTRILITCTIEWSKSSWIKGAIEKGANEGQISFAKDLLAELRKKLEGGSAGGKRKTNGKKKGGKRKREENKDEKAPTEEKNERGGVIGMCQQVAESAGDILGPLVKPLFSSTGLISFLLILVFYGLIRVERTMTKLSAAKLATGTSDTLRSNGVVDQDMLWDWIDSRIGKVSKEMRDGQVIWNNLVNEGVTQDGLEEVEDAIKVTEGKLKALKGAVGRKRSNTA